MPDELTSTSRVTGIDALGLWRGAPALADGMEAPFAAWAEDADLPVTTQPPPPNQVLSFFILLVGDDAGCAPCAWNGFYDLGGDTKPVLQWVSGLDDALRIIRNLPVDQIFCDLPDNAQGLRCIELLHQASGEIPVVALTACENSELSRRLGEIGIAEHLSRGHINSSSVRRIIDRAIERKIYRAQVAAVLRRECLRGEMLARISGNAPLNVVLSEVNRALQREAGCDGYTFVVDLKGDSAKPLSRLDDLGAAAQNMATTPSNVCLLSSDHRRCSCAAYRQPIRSGSRLLGELTVLPDSCGDTNDTVLAYAKLGAELIAQTIERLQASELLRQTQANLKRLSEQLLNTQEAERQRIASDLHDVIGQSLSVVKVAIEDAEQRFRLSGLLEVAAILRRLIPWVRTALGEVRRISMDLRPATIDDLGMLPTLSWFLREFGASFPGLAIEQRITIRETDVPEKLKIVIFRILQEAMSNIVKHAHATRVQVILKCVDSTLRLVIVDNGVGFDATARRAVDGQRPGIGLSSMRERGRASGGSYALESRPGDGTTILVSWPLLD